jgi:hypothetical protein
MPVVEFAYTSALIPASDAFPSGQVAYRPMALAGIHVPGSPTRLRCMVCLDSGADHCVFPAAFAQTLGIDLLSLKKQFTGGVGSTANPTYYTELEISMGSGIEFKTLAGFTPGLDAQGTGLLGQLGFFERYNVSFRHKERKIIVETA